MGHRAASCAHLINESARREQTVYWDLGREALKTGHAKLVKAQSVKRSSVRRTLARSDSDRPSIRHSIGQLQECPGESHRGGQHEVPIENPTVVSLEEDGARLRFP